jgi:uncharacterized sulfatase
MLTDGGIRTPFLAAWPGTLPAQKTFEPGVINLDVAATAVAVAGLPDDKTLDGVNLMPFLLGEKDGTPHDALFWRWRSQAAIRTEQWKYILIGEKERYLFNVRGQGETETDNLVAKHPDVAVALEKRLMEWDATLLPPGLPRESVSQDQKFFEAHVEKRGVPVTKPQRAGNATGKN